MPYRFKDSDDDIASGLQRMAGEQIDRALASLDDPALAEDRRIHEARKRIKKTRGLLRLVRPDLPVFKRERRDLRKAARTLAVVRDQDALIETYDRIMDDTPTLRRRDYAALRRRLTAERKVAAEGVEDRVAVAAGLLTETRGRLDEWVPDRAGWRALSSGLAKTYGRAREARRAAARKGGVETFHDWRKRVKYHRYHAQILRDIWAEPMALHIEAADHLGDVLGRHHDAALLLPWLDHAPIGTDARQALRDVIDDRMRAAEAEALRLGHRLLADRPKALCRRWGAWWEISPLAS